LQEKKTDGSVLNKIVLVSWCPDNSGIRNKMLHGSTTGVVKETLGIDKKLQGSSPADISMDELKALLNYE
jgi:hypothetical protein